MVLCRSLNLRFLPKGVNRITPTASLGATSSVDSRLTDYSNTWYLQSSSDSAALSGFGLSEAHLFKEFASHVVEPLKDTDTVNLQYEAVCLLRITFKFRLGVFGWELLLSEIFRIILINVRYGDYHNPFFNWFIWAQTRLMWSKPYSNELLSISIQEKRVLIFV